MVAIAVKGWQRIEVYASFIFSGMRLAIWGSALCLLLGLASYDHHRRMEYVVPGAVGLLLLVVAEGSLVHFQDRVLKKGVSEPAELVNAVCGRVRGVRFPLRQLLGFGYLASAAVSVLYVGLMQRNWTETFHVSFSKSLVGGLVLIFAMSYSSNLALVCGLAACGAPSGVTRFLFRHRLLIDAIAAVALGGGVSILSAL